MRRAPQLQVWIVALTAVFIVAVSSLKLLKPEQPFQSGLFIRQMDRLTPHILIMRTGVQNPNCTVVIMPAGNLVSDCAFENLIGQR